MDVALFNRIFSDLVEKVKSTHEDLEWLQREFETDNIDPLFEAFKKYVLTKGSPEDIVNHMSPLRFCRYIINSKQKLLEAKNKAENPPEEETELIAGIRVKKYRPTR